VQKQFRNTSSAAVIFVLGAIAGLSLAILSNTAAGQAAPSTQTSSGDWKQVEDAMGRPGQMMEDVIKFGMPRKDLHVTLNGVAIKPGLALGSWVAFKKAENGAMVMGDLVLTQEEVEPVMRKLQEGGVEISAVHNHLIGETPRVMYMHVASQGDAVKMAKAIHDAVALTKTPGPDAAGAAATSPEALGIEQKKIEDLIGHPGKVNGGILQFTVPRAEEITDNGMTVPPEIKLATAAAQAFPCAFAADADLGMPPPMQASPMT